MTLNKCMCKRLGLDTRFLYFNSLEKSTHQNYGIHKCDLASYVVTKILLLAIRNLGCPNFSFSGNVKKHCTYYLLLCWQS